MGNPAAIPNRQMTTHVLSVGPIRKNGATVCCPPAGTVTVPVYVLRHPMLWAATGKAIPIKVATIAKQRAQWSRGIHDHRSRTERDMPTESPVKSSQFLSESEGIGHQSAIRSHFRKRSSHR